MLRFLTLIFLVVIACLIAASYGALHDQLTYTVSHEFYTKFKFIQFGFAEDGMGEKLQNPRLHVALVGVFAAWWMGVPIGLLIGLFSMNSNIRLMIRHALGGFMVVICSALAIGLIGLTVGFFIISTQTADELRLAYFIPPDLVQYQRFIAAGSMHNFSYLGGAIGLIAALIYVGWKRNWITLSRANKD